jgi:hypothetical protein
LNRSTVSRAILLTAPLIAGGVAMCFPTPLAVEIAVTAAALVFGCNLVGAAVLTGRGRAFCGGFAIFGLAYAVLALGPWFSAIQPRLLTTKALELMRPAPAAVSVANSVDTAEHVLLTANTIWLDQPATVSPWLRSVIADYDGEGRFDVRLWSRPAYVNSLTVWDSPVVDGSVERLFVLGQLEWSLFLGLAGGLVACWLARMAQRETAAPAKEGGPAVSFSPPHLPGGPAAC